MIPLTGHQGCLIACAVIALAAGALGWTLNGWRLGTQHEADQRAQAQTLAAAQAVRIDVEATYRLSEQQAAQAAAQAQSDYHEALSHAQAENDSLRAAVDDGRRRLLVRATCPAADHPVSADASAAGGINAAGAELDADARPDYFALVAAAERAEQQITALQQYAKACHLLTQQAH